MTGSDDEFNDFLTRRKLKFAPPPDDGLEPPAELDRIVLRQARDAIEAGRPQRVFRAPRWGAPLALAASLLVAFTIILHVGMPQKAPPPAVTVQNVARRLDTAAAAPAATPPAAQANKPTRDERAAASASAGASASGAVVVDLAEPLQAKRAASYPAASPLESRATMADKGSQTVVTQGLVSEEEADRYALPPPTAPSDARRAAGGLRAGVVVEDPVTGSRSVVTSVQPPPTEAQQAMERASPQRAWRRDSRTWLAEIDRLRASGKIAEADAELAEYKRQRRAYAVGPDR